MKIVIHNVPEDYKHMEIKVRMDKHKDGGCIYYDIEADGKDRTANTEVLQEEDD